jgi:hypothetical protein
MLIAERVQTALPIIETLTKFGLEGGATLEASIFDPRVGVANPWLADWAAGTWGASKAVEALVEGDLGRYKSFANVSAADADSDYLVVYIEVTAGGAGGTQKDIALVDNFTDVAKQSTGGPGPWTTASGNPVIANPIIDAINAQTSILLAACGDECEEGCSVILPTLYTGHKGTNLITPIYRNGTLMPDSELANGSQFSMNIRNITADLAYNLTDVVFAGTGHLSYRTRAGDGIFEAAGKWEYQSDGLTQQGFPFESQRLTVRVYDDV